MCTLLRASPQESTFNTLSPLRVRKFRVKTLAHREVFVGGFGDVEQAELRNWFFRRNTKIALKKLRPQGTRAQRIRIAAVSALCKADLRR